MRIPDHLTCLLRNLYAGQEIAELDMKQWTGPKLGKEYGLFNFYAEYIMRNTGLDEAQAGIKIARRNTSDMQIISLLWQKAKRNQRTS